MNDTQGRRLEWTHPSGKAVDLVVPPGPVSEMIDSIADALQVLKGRAEKAEARIADLESALSLLRSVAEMHWVRTPYEVTLAAIEVANKLLGHRTVEDEPAAGLSVSNVQENHGDEKEGNEAATDATGQPRQSRADGDCGAGAHDPEGARDCRAPDPSLAGGQRVRVTDPCPSEAPTPKSGDKREAALEWAREGDDDLPEDGVLAGVPMPARMDEAPPTDQEVHSERKLYSSPDPYPHDVPLTGPEMCIYGRCVARKADGSSYCAHHHAKQPGVIRREASPLTQSFAASYAVKNDPLRSGGSDE